MQPLEFYGWRNENDNHYVKYRVLHVILYIMICYVHHKFTFNELLFKSLKVIKQMLFSIRY